MLNILFLCHSCSQLEDVKVTTPKEIIAKLPASRFRGSALSTTAGDSSLCAVCQCEYEDGDEVTHLPCRHAYHKGCVEKWLESYSRSCPVCKENVC